MAHAIAFPWWQWLPFWSWRLVATVESADDVPERLPRNGVVLVGNTQYPKWIAFDCPCRLGHRIMINADVQRRPFWSIAQGKTGRVTLSPSVNYFDQAKRCHYIMRDGKIRWAQDSHR